jgi:hypothetical protein
VIFELPKLWFSLEGTEGEMSDGNEERKEQEERRQWEKRKDREDNLERDWPRDEEQERLDSLSANQVRLQTYLTNLPDRVQDVQPNDYSTKLRYDWCAGI